MKDFWKNEWQLFLDDMQTLGEFFLQPVTFSSKSLQLQASVEERNENTEVQNVGYNKEKEGTT